MKKTFTKVVLAVVALIICLGCPVLSQPMLKDGERMVFFGDSITEQQIYSRYIMNYFALRYPDAKITFRNAGWGGDRSPGGLNRLKRDVLSLKPSVVSLCFGMNDGGYRDFDQGLFDTYMTGMKGLVSELKAAGVKVVLLTPGCVDPDRNGSLKNYNNTLALFGKGVVELAAKERLPVYDINKLMWDIQTQVKAADPSFTMIPDSVHPNAPGHILMAYGLIKDLGCESSASGLTIDAAKAEVEADRCRVENLKIKTDAITFVRTDDALPIFYEPGIDAILKFAPYISTLNEYKLKVTGLKPGNWKLTVQGVEVGKFSADALASGVDLSNMPGPWKTLAEKVNAISANQEYLYFSRWRMVELINFPSEVKRDTDALLNKLDNLIAAREAERAKAVANRKWRWSLVLVK
ncbi:MAG: SGNH/GDSL hydrolase family protein [Armatimonadota bacterium]|nr:SGNH/GDSL hydrolase family protein [bacterium]